MPQSPFACNVPVKRRENEKNAGGESFEVTPKS